MGTDVWRPPDITLALLGHNTVDPNYSLSILRELREHDAPHFELDRRGQRERVCGANLQWGQLFGHADSHQPTIGR